MADTPIYGSRLHSRLLEALQTPHTEATLITSGKGALRVLEDALHRAAVRRGMAFYPVRGAEPWLWLVFPNGSRLFCVYALTEADLPRITTPVLAISYAAGSEWARRRDNALPDRLRWEIKKSPRYLGDFMEERGPPRRLGHRHPERHPDRLF